MTTLIAAAILSWGQPTPRDVIHGTSTYYADGLMQQVIANRGLSYSDGVALNRAGDLGRMVWLQWDTGEITGPLPVVDCAQEGHFETRERQGRWWNSARSWHGNGDFMALGQSG